MKDKVFVDMVKLLSDTAMVDTWYSTFVKTLDSQQVKVWIFTYGNRKVF